MPWCTYLYHIYSPKEQTPPPFPPPFFFFNFKERSGLIVRFQNEPAGLVLGKRSCYLLDWNKPFVETSNAMQPFWHPQSNPFSDPKSISAKVEASLFHLLTVYLQEPFLGIYETYFTFKIEAYIILSPLEARTIELRKSHIFQSSITGT